MGEKAATDIRDLSLKVYETAAEHARKQGIIIADTKFEFGVLDGRTILGDEVLTPDSSRFWSADDYEVGREQASFDKQFVRNCSTPIGTARQSAALPPTLSRRPPRSTSRHTRSFRAARSTSRWRPLHDFECVTLLV